MQLSILFKGRTEQLEIDEEFWTERWVGTPSSQGELSTGPNCEIR